MVKFELLRLAKFVKHLLSRFFSAGKQGALYSYRRRRNLWDCYAVDARFLWILKVGTQQIDETVLNANAGLKVYVRKKIRRKEFFLQRIQQKNDNGNRFQTFLQQFTDKATNKNLRVFNFSNITPAVLQLSGLQTEWKVIVVGRGKYCICEQNDRSRTNG